ncbi:hypothetical protein LJC58_07520, partial [Lachnospiraceae bacterium OttesenSCG-928-D06]|nr:hypothetical protein [Lachnospiraceae bacterium OttesenSCG-928-D06]
DIFLNINYKVEVILAIFFLGMILLSCSAEGTAEEMEYNKKVVEEEKMTESEDIIVEISMEEAIDIGMSEAQKYYDNLKVTKVYSYDNDSIPLITAGNDGKRECWYVQYANSNSNYVMVLILNGEVFDVWHFEEHGNSGLIEWTDIKVTTKEAVEKASEIGLCGGNPEREEEWITGYNFQLLYSSLVGTPEEEKIFLEVIGISPNGNFARVDFDASTGEILLAEEKIEHDNGDTEWKAFYKEELGEFNEIFATLREGQSYAKIDLEECDMSYFLVANNTYIYDPGVNATIICDVYGKIGEEILFLGEVTSAGTAYPLSYDKDYIYGACGNAVSRYVLDIDETKMIEIEDGMDTEEEFERYYNTSVINFIAF